MEWRPIIGTDCIQVAIMELTSEDTALLIASESVNLKLKIERNGVHEINQLRGQYAEYHHLFPQLKANDGFFGVLEWILERSPTLKLNTA
jgi:hypothetical protein